MFDAYDRDGATIANVMNELKTNGGFACRRVLWMHCGKL